MTAISHDSPKYYKVLNTDGSCFHGGSGRWFLPHGTRSGKWMPRVDSLEFCQRGYHILTADQLIHWLGPAIFEVEPKGDVLRQSDKCLCPQARLIRRCEGWNEKTARLFAADCAEWSLHYFEAERPNDDGPRRAIQAARDFANGKITDAAFEAAAQAAFEAAARAAAGAAARYAARDAAWYAAWYAAEAAAGAAAWYAAEAAARDAAWYAAEAAAGAAAWAELTKLLIPLLK